ncbi:MAG TPA: OmpA family protein, partial [Terriglobia bacterium]|nr:OmpA family protein [Terriglobia bacterium]
FKFKGYASTVGSAALNQQLSTERAENVADFLERQARPDSAYEYAGARGDGNQQAGGIRRDLQREGHRVVVSILQNNGIAGD